MSESTSAPHPGFLSRATTALTQWIDSDYCPDGADKMRAEPDRVDFVRVMPFVVLHLACFAVIWVGWSPVAVWTAVALYFIRMFAVTGIHHRYFSHKTYSTSRGGQMLVWGFFISTTFLFHGTACINSMAHLMGKRRFKTEDDSRNSFILTLITLGEGWHNNHHRFQSCTRNGFYWWEIDPTYYGLKMLSWTGLIWGLKPVPQSILDEGIHADHHASVAAAATARAASAQSSHDYATLRRVVPVATAMAVATATASSANLPKKADGPAIRKDLSEEAHGLNTPPPAGPQAPSV